MKVGFMLISPVYNTAARNVSFGKKLYLDSSKIGKEAFWDEAKKSEQVRKKTEIYAPVYRHATRNAKGEMKAEYEISGMQANVAINPIKEKHLESLFKNFFSLEKAGILHENLSLEHLYFTNDGKVNIDGFRHCTDFYLSNGKFTGMHVDKNSAMPSNAQEFAEAGLAEYVASIKPEKAQLKFLEGYLPAKGKYHLQRAYYLKNNAGLSLNDKAMQIELAKANVYNAPNLHILRNELDKLNLYKMGNNALELWKDGCGAFDGIKKPNQKINSVLLLFDCLKYSMQLKDSADSLSFLYNNDSDKVEYFKFEKEHFDDFNKKLIECIKTAGAKTFTEKTFARRPFTVIGSKSDLDISKEAKIFENLCSKIDMNSSYEEAKDTINKIITRYGSLAYQDFLDETNTDDKSSINYA